MSILEFKLLLSFFQQNFTLKILRATMGFEYKLKTKLTDRQTTENQELLENSDLFEKKHEYLNQLFLDFRNAENAGKTPNINIIFEMRGFILVSTALLIKML